MNRLLEKQINRLRRSFSDDKTFLNELLKIAGNTYDDFEKERRRKDHASKLMSDELLELNANIRNENRVFVSSVLSSIVQAAIITDDAGEIIEMNQSAVEILGSLNKELIHCPFTNILVNKMEFKAFVNHYNEVSFNETTNYVEQFLFDSDRNEISCELSISEYNLESEHYYIFLIRDISKRKEFEDDIIRSKEEAEKASLSKSDFLSTMSHEIRTPLNSIIGITNIMMMDDADDKNEKYLDILKTNSENLLSLINDILDFNKIESGKIDFSKSEFNLYQLISRIVDANTFRTIEKNIKLELNYDKRVPEVVIGDSNRLSQIMINLISNAIKFTEKGGVTISVSLKNKIATEWDIRISVKDSGIGIAPKEHSQIFERFTQSMNPDSRQHGGTGLGLAITKKLVELQNGTIEVLSELGRGSEFIVCLSFDKAEYDNSKLSPDSNELNSSKVNPGNVLLVEDNKSNQYVISEFFKKWGWSYDLAENGMSAIEMADQKQYDLILMDLNMPVLDGYQATIRLRKNPNYAETPIIALTASATLDVQKKAEAAGVTDFMAKPFDPTELHNMIITNTQHKKTEDL